MQDGWRLAFFAAGRGADAFINDAAWTLVLFPGFLVLGAIGLNASLFAILLLWGISGRSRPSSGSPRRGSPPT